MITVCGNASPTPEPLATTDRTAAIDGAKRALVISLVVVLMTVVGLLAVNHDDLLQRTTRFQREPELFGSYND